MNLGIKSCQCRHNIKSNVPVTKAGKVAVWTPWSQGHFLAKCSTLWHLGVRYILAKQWRVVMVRAGSGGSFSVSSDSIPGWPCGKVFSISFHQFIVPWPMTSDHWGGKAGFSRFWIRYWVSFIIYLWPVHADSRRRKCRPLQWWRWRGRGRGWGRGGARTPSSCSLQHCRTLLTPGPSICSVQTHVLQAHIWSSPAQSWCQWACCTSPPLSLAVSGRLGDLQRSVSDQSPCLNQVQCWSPFDCD